MARYYRYLNRKRPPPQITISILESTYQYLMEARKNRNQPVYDIVDSKMAELKACNGLRTENETLRQTIGHDFDIKQELKIRVEELEREVRNHRQDILRLQSVLYSLPNISSIYI